MSVYILYSLAVHVAVIYCYKIFHFRKIDTLKLLLEKGADLYAINNVSSINRCVIMISYSYRMGILHTQWH